MELQLLQQHLSEYAVLLRRYADYENQIESERLRIMYHNSRGKHIALGVIAALLSVSVFRRLFGETFIGSFLILGCFAGIIFLVVNVIGPMFDRKKREQMKHAARLRFAPLVKEMDEIAIAMEESDVLPEKYKTLHAVTHLSEYIKNRRVDSLKEAINLYEHDLHHYQQQKSMNSVVGNQMKVVNQQKAMIKHQREMVRAQRTTNALLLWFK